MPDLASLAAAALARDGAQAAVEFEGRWVSWGEMRAVADAMVAGLSADGPVLFIARSHPGALAVLLGLIAQSRTIRMLYPFQSATSLATKIGESGAGCVILDARDCAPEIEAAAAQAGMAVLVLDGMTITPLPLAGGSGGGNAAGAVPLDIPSPNPSRKREGDYGEPRIEILTSGTTGPPKTFPLPYAMIADHYVGTAPWDEAEMAALPPTLLYFPLGNISGIYSTLPPLLKGQRAVLLERFSLEQWHDYVVRHRPTQSGIPPASMRQLLDANIPVEDLSSIKTMGSGAAPLDPALQAEFEARYGIPILLSYGATEFGGPAAYMTPALHAEFGQAKHGTVGRPGPGVSIRVVDPETGADLPRGETGLLHVISPRIGPDWIITSDLGHLDEDGFLFLHGRADGAIMRGGFKILPETIERALLLHPDVAEVCVVAVPDARVGQVPGAAIALRKDVAQASPESFESHLRTHVLATHIPVHWHFCDQLPRTISFKIDRNAVRTFFA